MLISDGWQCRGLVTAAETNGRLAVAIATQLMGAHGSAQFDKLTKTKTVRSPGSMGSSVVDGNGCWARLRC
jgi:hypothetical protein